MTYVIHVHENGSTMIVNKNHHHEHKPFKHSFDIDINDKINNNGRVCYLYQKKRKNIISPVFVSLNKLKQYAKENDIKIAKDKVYINNLKKC